MSHNLLRSGVPLRRCVWKPIPDQGPPTSVCISRRRALCSEKYRTAPPGRFHFELSRYISQSGISKHIRTRVDLSRCELSSVRIAEEPDTDFSLSSEIHAA